MPRDPKARKRQDIPPFLVAARGFYGEAFEPRRKSDLAESMADWAELTEDERSFALAHLQYLSLVAQAGTQRLLGAVLEVLEEIEDGVGEALEGQAVEPEVDGSEIDEFELDEEPEHIEDFDPNQPTALARALAKVRKKPASESEEAENVQDEESEAQADDAEVEE